MSFLRPKKDKSVSPQDQAERAERGARELSGKIAFTPEQLDILRRRAEAQGLPPRQEEAFRSLSEPLVDILGPEDEGASSAPTPSQPELAPVG